MKLLVFSNARDGRDDEYNEWYNTKHLPDLLSVSGVVSGARYRVQPRGDEVPEHRYLAIYELTGDPEAVLKELGERTASGEFSRSDSVDGAGARITLWEPL